MKISAKIIIFRGFLLPCILLLTTLSFCSKHMDHDCHSDDSYSDDSYSMDFMDLDHGCDSDDSFFSKKKKFIKGLFDTDDESPSQKPAFQTPKKNVNPQSFPSITTIAGKSGQLGNADGQGEIAHFSKPYGVAFGYDRLYVADYDNHVIRAVTPEGNVTTLSDFKNVIRYPYDLIFDKSGRLLVSASGSHQIFLITLNASGKHQDDEVFAGKGRWGSMNGNASDAQFDFPTGLAFGPDESLYVADYNNNKIRKVTIKADGLGDMVSDFSETSVYMPTGLAFDKDGNLFISFNNSKEIHRMAPGETIPSYYTALPEMARGLLAYNQKWGLLVGSLGYIHRIGSNGNVITFMGDGTRATKDGSGSTIQVNNIYDFAFSPDGSIYSSDAMHHVIRKITPPAN